MFCYNEQRRLLIKLSWSLAVCYWSGTTSLPNDITQMRDVIDIYLSATSPA
jgi:hypothetical protein